MNCCKTVTATDISPWNYSKNVSLNIFNCSEKLGCVPLTVFQNKNKENSYWISLSNVFGKTVEQTSTNKQ